MDNVTGDSDICVKISTSATDTPTQRLQHQLYFQLACGQRSQNFIDQVFRAASYANKDTTSDKFSWLSFYNGLVMSDPTKFYSNPFLEEERQFYSSGGMSESNSKETLDQSTDDEEENIIPGVANANIPKSISSVHGRELLLRNILETKKSQYTDLGSYKVFIGTWNVNGQSPGSVCLKDWLARTPEPPDFYGIGFQELDLSKEAFVFYDSPKEKEWLISVKRGLHPGAKYKRVKLIRLVGMMLIVFVKEELQKSVHNIIGEYLGTGLLGKLGNKGGVAVRFDMEETSMCFVNCHLAAHVEEYQRRNQDYNQILTRMIFNTVYGSRHIKDHDQIFWFGDMNYRIDPMGIDPDKAKSLIKSEKYSQVLKFDQLKDQMKKETVFVGFKEGPINFRPTYKYDVNTDNWDSSEKNRSPAWCDRVLWKGNNISQIDYVSVQQYKLSDHKPVSSLFETKINVLNQQRFRKVYEDALKWLDKEENKCLPQVSVDVPGSGSVPHANRNEINFGTIKFLEPVRRSFSVRNVGQFAVRLEFIKKLNDNYICKDWLTIEPVSAFIEPDQSCEIQLELLVDRRSAGSLNIGSDKLYDILVLHLEGGKDIFVTVLGEYERSVFGCSITALVNMPEPIKEISPGKLIQLEKGKLPISKYDIPKEIWFLVDRLYKKGMQNESMFQQSGLTTEVLQIRDWLDEIPNTPMPGSISSVAETLVMLLESFPEPVIPYEFHLRCMDAASNYISCKQVLNQIPDAHRNVFVYICTFLRELLQYSEKNGLDAKFLAILFGRVLLRDQNQLTRAKERDEKRKEAFVYQFLVNDDTDAADRQMSGQLL